jgi:hypothetical protein
VGRRLSATTGTGASVRRAGHGWGRRAFTFCVSAGRRRSTTTFASSIDGAEDEKALSEYVTSQHFQSANEAGMMTWKVCVCWVG